MPVHQNLIELLVDTSWTYTEFLTSFAKLVNPKDNFVSMGISDTTAVACVRSYQQIFNGDRCIQKVNDRFYMPTKSGLNPQVQTMFRINYEHTNNL